MYPSSTSSSSNSSMGPNGATNSGLMRYGSAPGSLLTTAVDSVIGSTHEFSALGSSSPSASSSPYTRFTTESNCKASNNNKNSPLEQQKGVNVNTSIGLRRSYGLKQDGTIGSGGLISSDFASPLVRQSSLPAGFLNHLPHASTSNDDNGFSITRGRTISRLNSQLSFTRPQTLSQISEENENVVNDLNTESDPKKSNHSYASTSYGVGSWEDSNALMFSMGQNKRSKTISTDIVDGLNSMESQFQFSMPQTLEMTPMEKFLKIPQDSVPCKIRAKRGFATHPRSIAERERRTRISGKLRKLHELVPNMDKQTSYADMLDLAVQHIKGLQDQVQKLNKEVENCTCGCKNHDILGAKKIVEMKLAVEFNFDKRPF